MSDLKRTQEWFGGVISRPIDDESRMPPLAEGEAAAYILPSPALKPDRRIELYCQQYWWRLLSSLQESFPFLTRLLGYREFNRVIAKPYLVKYPSRHWTLNLIGDRLAQWIEEEYEEEDKELLMRAAALDFAFEQSFLAAEYPPIVLDDLEDVEQFLATPLYLQPHMALFSYPYDLLSCRREFLKHEPEYWEEHPFPEMAKGDFHFVLFRDFQNDIRWELVPLEEYQLLCRFQQGVTLNEVLDRFCAIFASQIPRETGAEFEFLPETNRRMPIGEGKNSKIAPVSQGDGRKNCTKSSFEFKNLHHCLQQWAALKWLTKRSS